LGRAEAVLGEKLSLENGGVEMDTKLVETQTGPLTVTRENALFAGRDEGGRSWARVGSLIATRNSTTSSPTLG